MTQHHNQGSSNPRSFDSNDADLAVECPFCGHHVPHPGPSHRVPEVLAECDRCDIYFDFEPGDVVPTTARHVAVAAGQRVSSLQERLQ